jgi:hypothetical protein
MASTGQATPPPAEQADPYDFDEDDDEDGLIPAAVPYASIASSSPRIRVAMSTPSSSSVGRLDEPLDEIAMEAKGVLAKAAKTSSAAAALLADTRRPSQPKKRRGRPSKGGSGGRASVSDSHGEDSDSEDEPGDPIPPEYPEGRLVWARQKTYSYWPSIITVDPMNARTARGGHDNGPGGRHVPRQVHVHFLGYHKMRAWVAAAALIDFEGKDAYDKMAATAIQEHNKQSKVFYPEKKSEKKCFDNGVAEAVSVMPLELKKRLQKLGLVYVAVAKSKSSSSSSSNAFGGGAGMKRPLPTYEFGRDSSPIRFSPFPKKRRLDDDSNGGGQTGWRPRAGPIYNRQSSFRSETPARMAANNGEAKTDLVDMIEAEEAPLEKRPRFTGLMDANQSQSAATPQSLLKRPQGGHSHAAPSPVRPLKAAAPGSSPTGTPAAREDEGEEDDVEFEGDDSVEPQLGSLAWGRMTGYP